MGGDRALTETESVAVLLSVDGVGPATVARIVERLGSAVEAVRLARGSGGGRLLVEALARPDDPRPLLGPALALAVAAAAETAAGFLDDLAAREIRLVAPAEPAYPARLRAIEDPPVLLFVHGDLGALAAPAPVAIVGTRRPTDGGRLTAARIAAALARAGASVISGLAVGIDGSAHAATVAEGGRTIAVIGGGHGHLFPRVHARLARAIVDAGGAVVSEHAPASRPTRGTFPRRNRIISGLADAVVIVEAGARSGALLTGAWALEQGREVFAVPGSIDAPASAGCNGFLREFHGLVRIVSGIPQLLDDLGLPGDAALAPRGPGDRAERARRSSPGSSGRLTIPSTDAVLATVDDPLDRQVALAVVRGAATVDELVAITGAPVAATLAALTRLEGAGLVATAGGRTRATHRMGEPPRTRGPEGTVAART